MVKREIINLGKITNDLLQERKIKIRKIVLFGSYAKGTEKETSDIDIIIISKDFRNKDIFEKIEMAKGVHRELVKIFLKPMDLLYYSDIEWNMGNSIVINAAKHEGKVIYEEGRQSGSKRLL